jgi:iron complex outermembrane receptor protein
MSISSLRVSAIALAVSHACSFHAHAQSTAPAADPTLPEVVVSANRVAPANRASVAGFGETPLLETPASVSVFTQEQMQDFRIRSTTDASRFDASVSDSYNAVGYAEQFSIRGFALDNNYSYRKDGLAIPADTQIPLENKERIEILKGLAGFQAGVAAPGGIVDYVTKRPTAAPLRTVTVEASERGTLYGAVDLSGKLDDPRFGYRINAAAERLRSYIKGADGNRKFVSGAFDWQLTPQALLQLDMDYQKKAQISAPGYQLIDGTMLPTGISADTLLNDQPWSKPVDTTSSNVGLRFTYTFNPEWQASISANRHSFKRDDYTAFPYGCSSQALFPGYCSNGDYDVYDYQSLGEKKKRLATQALLQGKFAAGGVRHALTLGLSWFERKDYYGDYLYEFAGVSNIYNPVVVLPTGLTSGPVTERRSEHERAVFAQDVINLSSNWTLHAAARHVQLTRSEVAGFEDSDAANPDAPIIASEDAGFWLPSLALVYSPVATTSLYASWSQGLEHGGIAPVGTTNANSALAAGKSRQVELGVKLEPMRDLMLGAALFQITKGLEYTDDSNTYVRNGEARNRGLELSARGQLTPALTLGVSATALNTKQEGTGLADTDGKHVTNVPNFKSSVYADYALPQVPGLKLNGTWLYSGKKAFDKENTVYVPSYHVFNFGVAYATKIGGTPAVLRANVDNAFDKFYWRDVTQELGGYLLPGASRTFKLSATFSF